MSDQYGALYRLTPPAAGETIKEEDVQKIPADIGGARNAGAKSGAALWGSKAVDALIAARPDVVLDSPDELLALFEAD